jgi:hypothetical protein
MSVHTKGLLIDIGALTILGCMTALVVGGTVCLVVFVVRNLFR